MATDLILETAAGATEAAAIISAAREGAAPRELKPGGVYAVPTANGDLKLIDLHTPEHLFLGGFHPSFKAGTVHFADATSLAAYIQGQAAGEGPTPARLYANRAKATVEAVFDDDTDAGPGWRVHRAQMVLTRSKAWQAWLDRSGKYSNQEEFAEFLEDRAADVVNPTAAHLLEVATSIQAVATAKIEGGIRLQDGQVRLSYVETLEATAGKTGALTIPETFELGLAPFEGGDRFKVKARLRWRRAQGGLVLGLVLNEPDEIERAAFSAEIKTLTEATALPVIFGVPASPRI